MVLCLVIFAVIALMPALTDQDLAQSELAVVQGFFEADTLAEQVLAQLLATDYIPSNILGVEILQTSGQGNFSDVVDFNIDINHSQALFVQIGLNANSYEILQWRMGITRDWNAEVEFNIWDPGDDEERWGW